jgi:GTPase SAR1 family protein
MSKNSALITIGINRYKDASTQPLLFSVSDSLRISRFFKTFNMCDTSVSLINEEATLARILNEITLLSKTFKNIIIYFSGHGKRIDKNSYLYLYDSERANLKNTSLSLTTLVELIKQASFQSSMFIIDACNISYDKKTLEKNIKICAPNKTKTYESTSKYGGEFTEKWLNKFITQSKEKHLQRHASNRQQRIRWELETLLTKGNRKILITGESGVGKSYFLQQLAKNEKDIFYISIPKAKSLSCELILNIISEAITYASKKWNQPSLDTDPERHIRFYSQTNFHAIFLIDHIDRLHYKTLSKLNTILSELPTSAILTSRSKSKSIENFTTYLFPKLSSQDITRELKTIGITQNNIIKHCRQKINGNYLKLLKTINEKTFLNKESKDSIFSKESMKKAISSIVITGGFIQQTLFTATHKIKNKDIEYLKKSGMLILHNNYYYPHDSIYEIADYKNIKTLKQRASLYWKKEIVSNNYSSIIAIHNYVLVLNQFNPNLLKEDESFYIKLLDILGGRKNITFIFMIYEYLKGKNLSKKTRIILAEALIDIGKFKEASLILNETPNDNSLETLTLKSETLWWQGKFKQCITSSSRLLTKAPPPNIKLQLHCIRGIGQFFLGAWDLAEIDLINVIDNKTSGSDKKSVFLSYLVLATIQGIRGTNFIESVANFKKAMHIANKSGKLYWLSLTYGNIGETLWKAGFYKQAIQTLEIGSHVAYMTGNDPVELEMSRNLLHAYHYSNKLDKEKKLLLKLESIFNESMDSYVQMQIVNSLATHYLFSGNSKYKIFIKRAKKLTQDNLEYEIYTIANQALAFLYEGFSDKAKSLMEKALSLCKNGKNWLAIKQILNDWDEIIRLHQPHLMGSQQAFRKWHQMLEKRLLPFLSHLLCLCEYLERL